MGPANGSRGRRLGVQAGAAPGSERASVDGSNPFDPGVGLLGRAVADVPAREILLVACGEVPGVGPAAMRLVLDVRELDQPGARPFWPAPADTDPAFAGSKHALVWPRAHLGKDFTFACLARGALALADGGGVLWCAVRKAKGADSIAAFLERLAGDGRVGVAARDRGYRLLRAEIGPQLSRELAREALAVRYELTDPILGDLRLAAVPGVFSRRALDDGTRALIEHAAGSVERVPARVLDLGAGIGPLACWAARRWPPARVLAVEPNLAAAKCCEDNARRGGVADRVVVVRAAGLPVPSSPELRAFEGAIDLALVNPPTHAPPEALARVVSDSLAWLGPRGRAMFVVSRASALAGPLRRLGASVAAHDVRGYTVVVASRPC